MRASEFVLGLELDAAEIARALFLMVDTVDRRDKKLAAMLRDVYAEELNLASRLLVDKKP